MAAKFVQISSVFDSNDDAPIVFALDAEGKVWEAVGDGWEPLPMKRLGSAAPENKGDDSNEDE